MQRFALGKHDYVINLTKQYNHDDEVQAILLVGTSATTNKQLCSSFKLAERDGKVVTHGTYGINRSNLQFSEHYFHPRHEQASNSMVKTFIPTPNGTLVLRKVISYKQGQATTTTS
ncbi:hypothetical protein ACW9KT_18760 [Hymenobacter sp. HD11105]